MRFDLISSASIISDYIQDTDTNSPINKAYFQRVVMDTLSAVTSTEQMSHKVALLPVRNNNAVLPDDFGKIIQIAYRGTDEELGFTTRLDIAQWVAKDGECDVEVNVKCGACDKPLVSCHCGEEVPTIINVDSLFRASPPPYLLSGAPYGHATRGGGLGAFSGKIPSTIYSNFRLIKPAQHSFHNADFHVGGCLNLDSQLMASEVVEYNITQDSSPKKIVINREGGEILLAYFAKPTDCDGFPLIPDRYEFLEAAKWAIEEKVHYKAFRKTKGKDDMALYQNASANKSKFLRMCRALDSIPDPEEFKIYWRNNMNKIISNHNAEYSFFRQENDKYYSVFRNRR